MEIKTIARIAHHNYSGSFLHHNASFVQPIAQTSKLQNTDPIIQVEKAAKILTPWDLEPLHVDLNDYQGTFQLIVCHIWSILFSFCSTK